MTPTDLLRQQLAEVAERRAKAETMASLLKAMRDEFDADNAEVIAEAARAKAALAESDANARALVVAMYQSDPQKNKKPAEGVTVRVTKVYTYDPVTALDWAREKKLALIPESLDEKAFLEIAKATPLPFVTITEEPSATLASDLSQYLAPAPSDATDLTPNEIAEIPF